MIAGTACSVIAGSAWSETETADSAWSVIAGSAWSVTAGSASLQVEYGL